MWYWMKKPRAYDYRQNDRQQWQRRKVGRKMYNNRGEIQFSFLPYKYLCCPRFTRSDDDLVANILFFWKKNNNKRIIYLSDESKILFIRVLN